MIKDLAELQLQLLCRGSLQAAEAATQQPAVEDCYVGEDGVDATATDTLAEATRATYNSTIDK